MKGQYSVQFINPVLSAVLNVLSTMANIEARPGKPYVNKKGTACGDITGSIEISGFTNGIISLTLEEKVILTIVNNMLYENFTEINDEIIDAVGELTNMISGQARSELSKEGISFKAGTPKVVLGFGEKIGHIESAPILAVPFQCDGGKLVVEISIS
ncbi:chemotaxis protein CheX [Desulfonatronovibrio magnus]|uniref:chemotaxis protein CheX n=1 Tax=Desulfonatronovibrio magnus TaxID=698827 RepID=UPI0005EB17F4|nr:chemotaxis protein CheX [Desulfonatronovibrio magnus]